MAGLQTIDGVIVIIIIVVMHVHIKVTLFLKKCNRGSVKK